VRNAFTIHLVNKRPEPFTFHVEPEAAPGIEWSVPTNDAKVEGLSGLSLPITAKMKRSAMHGNQPIRIRVRGPEGERIVEGTFVGPTAGLTKRSPSGSGP
jgi:hypothetical protein